MNAPILNDVPPFLSPTLYSQEYSSILLSSYLQDCSTSHCSYL